MPRVLTVSLGSMVLVALLCIPRSAEAAEYWVALTGSDSAAGSQAAPFATVARAQMAASPGDTVWIRGGTYAFTGSGTLGVAFTKSGQENSPIRYFAAPGEVPVFDLARLTPSGRVTGLDLRCNYVHLRGLEVTGVQQYESGQDSWGVRIQGSNNVLENLNVHHNGAPGIFITSGSNNLILNCDSHHNYDVLEQGLSGDGIGCHSSGGNNVMRGCRAYENSDDGFDFINARGSCIVEKSFAFRNGFIPGTSTAVGNGAGFKAGGYGSPPTVSSQDSAVHTVRQCVAFGNRRQGFYANHHPGRINFYNNVGFGNSVDFDMLADAGFPSSHEIRNNIAMSARTITALTGGTDTFNSWSLAVTVSEADFNGVMEMEALAPRQPDGSLPEMQLWHLSVGSDLIDKGVDVGLPFVGRAPDLGAFEFGASMGGSPGSAGAPSVAGAPGMGGSGGTAGSAFGGSLSAGGAAGTPPIAGTVNVAGSAAAASVGGSGDGGASRGGAVSVAGAHAGSSAAGNGVAAGAPGASAGAAGALGGPSESTDETAGCGCRAPGAGRGSSAPGLGALLALGVFVARVRRRG